jgi:hypothetical protein
MISKKNAFLNIFILISCITINGFAQRAVTSQHQIWMGYMTSAQLNPTYSLWNDIHLVPTGFFLLRTGITKDMKLLNVTIGYAYGRLPVSADNKSLYRIEHRPWAQAQASFSLPKQFVFIPRLRYDARFRQDVSNGELINSYSFINRVRMMATLRKFVTANETAIGKPFVGVSNELLLNFGKNVTFNRFDQNRLSLMAGTQYKNMQLQLGYMNRYVKTGTNQFTQNHTLVIWFTQKFNTKRLKTPSDMELDGE